jgi:hypothetical protein
MDYNEFQLLQWSFRLKIAAALDGSKPRPEGEYAAVIKLLDEKINALPRPVEAP